MKITRIAENNLWFETQNETTQDVFNNPSHPKHQELVNETISAIHKGSILSQDQINWATQELEKENPNINLIFSDQIQHYSEIKYRTLKKNQKQAMKKFSDKTQAMSDMEFLNAIEPIMKNKRLSFFYSSDETRKINRRLSTLIEDNIKPSLKPKIKQKDKEVEKKLTTLSLQGLEAEGHEPTWAMHLLIDQIKNPKYSDEIKKALVRTVENTPAVVAPYCGQEFLIEYATTQELSPAFLKKIQTMLFNWGKYDPTNFAHVWATQEITKKNPQAISIITEILRPMIQEPSRINSAVDYFVANFTNILTDDFPKDWTEILDTIISEERHIVPVWGVKYITTQIEKNNKKYVYATINYPTEIKPLQEDAKKRIDEITSNDIDKMYSIKENKPEAIEDENYKLSVKIKQLFKFY